MHRWKCNTRITPISILISSSLLLLLQFLIPSSLLSHHPFITLSSPFHHSLITFILRSRQSIPSLLLSSLKHTLTFSYLSFLFFLSFFLSFFLPRPVWPPRVCAVRPRRDGEDRGGSRCTPIRRRQGTAEWVDVGREEEDGGDEDDEEEEEEEVVVEVVVEEEEEEEVVVVVVVVVEEEEEGTVVCVSV